ncbi:MAG: phosphatidylserine decarboxylase [Acutalibacteraceae bacterium]
MSSPAASARPPSVRRRPAGADRTRRARLSAYAIRQSLFSSGTPYSVGTLLRGPRAGAPFRGRLCLIFRLTVGDYHRYCFFDDGVVLGGRFLPGVLHTVNPVALGGYDIYKENARAVTLLRTRSFGDAAQVEVGAMLVGRICNTHTGGFFFRGQEKGYFEYGGSTVVLLLRHGAAELRRDILRNTADGVETRVRQGERIGNAKRK